ncbi:putative oxalate/formate antiporter [Lutibaculum baratangense AMV1]|uniref:Putative oxalate/formate antiporter n=1 Tax=Lutibaculum baratangense AMV1 TaxID=631454 RepID=V4QSF4_9HYPH|nr:putative oxalate/formate antiporter [Lutibaculum baratangense AMV1]
MAQAQLEYGERETVLDGRYSWARLVASLVLATVGNVGLWSVILVLPEVQAEFAVDRGDASLAYTATMIGFAVGNLLLGRAVDRFGITVCIVGAAVALGAGYALAAVSEGLWQFAVLHAGLIGLGASATFAPLIADISHWFDRQRGFAVAITASGNYLAGVVWPMALKDVLAADGWRSAYLVIAIVCVSVMIPLALALRRRPLHVSAAGAVPVPPRQAIDLSPRTLQWLLVAAGVGCCVAMSMPQVHIVAYSADLGYGVAVGAQMLSLMLLGGVASRILSGFVADLIGGVRTLLIGSVLQFLALLFYIPFDGLASLYVVSLIFGLAQGGIVPCYAIIVREYLPAREAGQRVGLVLMSTVMGMALGGWMSGAIYDLTASYQAAFLNGIAFNLVNVAIMLFVLWRTRGPTTAPAAA